MPRVMMLYNKPRAERIAAAEQGRCPDEMLYGLLELRKRGWESAASDEGFANFFGGRLLKGIDNTISRGGRRVGFHLKQAWRLRGAIRKADVVLATADSSGLPVLLLQVLGLTRTPVVYCSIGLAETFGQPFGLVYALYRKLLKRAAHIVVYAQPEVEQLATMFGVPREKISFVPFGVESEFFTGEVEPANRPLAFGLDHRRDWPTFFAAAAGMSTTIDVITNTDLIRGQAVPRNVEIADPVPVDVLRDHLLAASFVVLPVEQNAYSGATISLLQAMAAGKAVIVSRTEAIAKGYGLVDGENCLLTPPGDVPALARAMARLQDDSELRARLGENAATHVRDKLHLRFMVDALERTLREALS